MTVRALVGLAIGNLIVLGVGCCLLWGARGIRSWTEVARLSGLAYLIGVATLGVALSVELVAGVPFGLASVTVTCLVLALAGLVLGRLFGRAPPRLRGCEAEGMGFVAASYGALVVVYVEALFRAGRLAPLSNYDGWAFWVPKARRSTSWEGWTSGSSGSSPTRPIRRSCRRSRPRPFMRWARPTS